MKLRYLVAAVAFAASPMAFAAAQCDDDLKKADAAIAAPKASVNAEDLAAAKTLRAQAGQELAAGKDVECVAIIGEALELLDVAEGGG